MEHLLKKILKATKSNNKLLKRLSKKRKNKKEKLPKVDESKTRKVVKD